MNCRAWFKSIFTIPEKSKTTEEQIGELVNKLILKLKADGKSIASPAVAENFGAFNIFVNDLGEENASIMITKIGEWEIEVKPIFNKF